MGPIIYSQGIWKTRLLKNTIDGKKSAPLGMHQKGLDGIKPIFGAS